jgi:hypothetical protein
MTRVNIRRWKWYWFLRGNLSRGRSNEIDNRWPAVVEISMLSAVWWTERGSRISDMPPHNENEVANNSGSTGRFGYENMLRG